MSRPGWMEQLNDHCEETKMSETSLIVGHESSQKGILAAATNTIPEIKAITGVVLPITLLFLHGVLSIPL